MYFITIKQCFLFNKYDTWYSLEAFRMDAFNEYSQYKFHVEMGIIFLIIKTVIHFYLTARTFVLVLNAWVS